MSVGRVCEGSGIEIIADQIDHRKVSEPALRAEGHLQMGYFMVLRFQLALDMSRELGHPCVASSHASSDRSSSVAFSQPSKASPSA